MSQTKQPEQWGIFEEGKDGSRTRVGTETFATSAQADTARTATQKQLQESPGEQPKIVAKRILNS